MTSIQQNNIGIKGTTVLYDPESDQYEIDLKNVALISLDSRTKVIRIKIKSDQIHVQQLKTISTQTIQTSTNTHNTDDTDAKENIAAKLKNTIDNISTKETEQQHIQNEIQQCVQHEDFEKASQLAQNKKQIISELQLLHNTAQTLQKQLEEQQALEKQQRLKEEMEKLSSIEQEIVRKQKAVQEIQNDILKVVAMDDFETAASLSHNKKILNGEIQEFETMAQTLKRRLEDDDNVDNGDTIENIENIDDDNDNEEDASTFAVLEECGDAVQTEEDDETETESGTSYKPKDTVSAPITPKEEGQKEEHNVESVKDNESTEEMIDIEEMEDVKDDEIEDVEQEKTQDIDEEVVEIDIEIIKEVEETEDNKEEEEEEDIEIVDIDVAMKEIILKSAQKKETDDDTGASTSNEYQFRVNWRRAFTAHNIKKEWIGRIPKSSDPSAEHFSCNVSISLCPCIDRLIFIMNNYMFWLKYKLSSYASRSASIATKYPSSMSELLDLLINYNKVRLMNDYFHIRRYHLNGNNELFFEYLSSQLVTTQCISLKTGTGGGDCVCLQWDRNNGNKEIYRLYATEQRRINYLITADSDIKALSAYEMNEINVLQFLDMVHSTLLHKSISSGKKFVNDVYLLSETDELKEEDGESIVDAPNYQFGLCFSYWDKGKLNYICAKYSNLKRELFANCCCKMDKNDYNQLWYKAKDFIQSNDGRYCISKRILSDRNSKIFKIGKEITMDHVMALMIYCNYLSISRELKTGCRRLSKRESLDTIKLRHSEIANWCKLMRETVYCFGDLLDSQHYLYHNIGVRLTFNVLQIEFNVASSTTMKYVIAKSFGKGNGNRGICLKLKCTSGVSRELNCFLNVCNISDFPNECECVVYGDKFDICDIIVNGMSSVERLNVLKLYYQIIRGRWYTQNKNQFKKKNQREIIKMIHNMMHTNANTKTKNDSDSAAGYIAAMFSSMTKNLRKNTVWVNRNGMEQLLPELKQLFFDEFLDYLQQNYNIKTKYSKVLILKINCADINKSSREKAIYSLECTHSVNIVNAKNIADLVFSFRCYKKYDAITNEMALKGEFVIKPFSNRIQAIRVSGGIWFPQLYLEKWDFCTFTQSKLTKGSSLFSLKKLQKVSDELIVKICFQVKDIIAAKV